MVLAAGFAATTTFLVQRINYFNSRQHAGADATTAARSEAVALLDLDYRKPDEALARAITGATGEFRRQLVASAASTGSSLAKSKVVSNAAVVSAGLVRSSRDAATVLVAANAQIRDGNSAPTGQGYRMSLQLTRDGARWLVSDVQFVR